MNLYLAGPAGSGVEAAWNLLRAEGVWAEVLETKGIVEGVARACGEDDYVLVLLEDPALAIRAASRRYGISSAAAAGRWERDLRGILWALREQDQKHGLLTMAELRAGEAVVLRDQLARLGFSGAMDHLEAFAKGRELGTGDALQEILNSSQQTLWNAAAIGGEVQREISAGGRQAIDDLDRAQRREAALRRQIASEGQRRFAIETNLLKAAGGQQREARRLEDLLTETEKATDRLLTSSRWRVGNFFSFRFAKERQGYGPLEKIFGKLREWREAQSDLPQETSLLKSGAVGVHGEVALPRPSLEVVVCIHDAPQDVELCLDSLLRHSGAGLRGIILVDDGSAAETVAILDAFEAHCPYPMRRVRHGKALGYTRAANAGLKHSRADYVVMVNSDTILPPGWVGRLLACGESDDAIGLVGAVSNAASWQSIPRRFDDSGDWAINALPRDIGAEAFALRHALALDPIYPRVPLLNGFFFAIKRGVISRVGLFDEEAFPRGYGEENDYCFRAREAGFDLAVADDLYVWHAKSKSYTHARRSELADASGKVLFERYGKDLELAQEELRSCSGLRRARESAVAIQDLPAPPFSCLYLAPFRGSGGGTHSIVQEAAGLSARGVIAQVGVLEEDLGFYRQRYDSMPGGIFVGHEGEDDLVQQAGAYDVVIATASESVPLLRDIALLHPSVLPAYYIQDDEACFFAEGDPMRQAAADSYTTLPQRGFAFAKTAWLCETISTRYGLNVRKVEPSLDTEVYHAKERESKGRVPVVVAMVRPDSPHRSPELTLALLQEVAIAGGGRVRAFGCDPDDPFLQGRDADRVEICGVLSREEVAAVLREADLFLDLSRYQAFGRTGLEAMACGCAVVLPEEGGVVAYAVDGENAVLVDTKDPEATRAQVLALAGDAERIDKLSRSGLETASRFSIAGAAESIERLILRALRSDRRLAG